MKPFRDFKIVRSSNVPRYKNYKQYRGLLRSDFRGRCAYCNLKEEGITDLPFQIDHFIPKAVFDPKEQDKPRDISLLTDYNNLIFSCANCNNAKHEKYQGDFPNDKMHNTLFYHPIEDDYNDYFYRDDEGKIQSDDELGKKMIIELRLHHPCHALEYLVESCTVIIETLEKKKDGEENKAVAMAYDEILHTYREKYFKYTHALRSAYKQKFDVYKIGKMLDA